MSGRETELFGLIVLMIVAACIASAASYLSGYKNGFDAGEASVHASWDEHNATMREIGFCEWPAAFYRSINCNRDTVPPFAKVEPRP